MNANTIKKLSVAALLVFAIAAPVGAHAGAGEATELHEAILACNCPDTGGDGGSSHGGSNGDPPSADPASGSDPSGRGPSGPDGPDGGPWGDRGPYR